MYNDLRAFFADFEQIGVPESDPNYNVGNHVLYSMLRLYQIFLFERLLSPSSRDESASNKP